MTRDARRSDRRAPSSCPVCGEHLHLTRLGCDECGTELSGHFPTCDFCALAADDRELLRVFLRSRGNMKEVERFLGVSYPTARARFDAVLGRLGLAPSPTAAAPQPSPAPGPTAVDRLAVLRDLAAGKVDVDAARDQLRG